jgi:hypothetical protein
VTVTITIWNKLRTPQQWEHTQAALFIPGTGSGPNYVENFAAEMRDRQACLWKTGTAAKGGLQPGAAVRCDLVFEIPTDADPASPRSTLEIANFGDDVSNASQPVGIIRTDH